MEPTKVLRNCIQVRLSDTAIEWLLQASAEQELRPSVLVRKLIERAAKHDLVQRGSTDGQQG
jgi:hypothetical protein